LPGNSKRAKAKARKRVLGIKSVGPVVPSVSASEESSENLRIGADTSTFSILSGLMPG
jgi:hypothetical protein